MTCTPALRTAIGAEMRCRPDDFILKLLLRRAPHRYRGATSLLEKTPMIGSRRSSLCSGARDREQAKARNPHSRSCRAFSSSPGRDEDLPDRRRGSFDPACSPPPSSPSSSRTRSCATICNVPNALSLLRLAVQPFLVGSFYCLGPEYSLLTTGLFAFSAATDYADGFAARILKQESEFGSWLDPVVDKIVVCTTSCLIIEKFAAAGGSCPSTMITLPVLVIVARELMVTGLRELYVMNLMSIKAKSSPETSSLASPASATRRTSPTPASPLAVTALAKWKTTLQLVSLLLLLYVEVPQKSNANGSAMTSRPSTTAILSRPNNAMGQQSTGHERLNESEAEQVTSREFEKKWLPCCLQPHDGSLHALGLLSLWGAAGLSVGTGLQYARRVWRLL